MDFAAVHIVNDTGLPYTGHQPALSLGSATNTAGRTHLSNDQNALADARADAPALADIADAFVGARREGRALSLIHI